MRCKNCNNRTTFGKVKDIKRKSLGLCVSCFKVWSLKQVHDAKRQFHEATKLEFNGPNVFTDLCRNCGKLTSYNKQTNPEREKERLCKRCYYWWQEDPDPDRLHERLHWQYPKSRRRF